jgi:hypothetical protein
MLRDRQASPRKIIDAQRERHLQPLVDRIGASERETCLQPDRRRT